MANIQSAKKRIRQIEKRRLANRNVRGAMRTAMKRAVAAADEKSPDLEALLKTATSHIDKAVSKGVLHRKTGSRYISRLVGKTKA